MDKNLIIETKLTLIQEKVLLEISKTVNHPFICKKISIKPITLIKTINTLNEKNLLIGDTLTEKGKKMVHYIEFKNETIFSFLNKFKIESTPEIINDMTQLNYKIIISLRNLL